MKLEALTELNKVQSIVKREECFLNGLLRVWVLKNNRSVDVVDANFRVNNESQLTEIIKMRLVHQFQQEKSKNSILLVINTLLDIGLLTWNYFPIFFKDFVAPSRVSTTEYVIE